MRGKLVEAVQTADEAIAAARALNDQFSLALAHVFASSVHEARRDVTAVKTHADAAINIARTEDFRLMDLWAAPLQGWSAVHEGRHGEGLQCIEGALAEARSNGSNSFAPYSLGLYAECCLIAGRTVDADNAIAEAFAIVSRTGERFWEAELLRLQGEIELVRSGGRCVDPHIEITFLTAIDVAHRAGARVLVLRASRSLAKFYHCLGRSSDGRRIVASAQSEFSEGLSLEDKDILEFLLREHDVGDSCIEG